MFEFGKIAIVNDLNVAKSTLHYWLKYIPSKFANDPALRLKHLGRARRLATRAIKAKKIKNIKTIQRRTIEEANFFPLGSSLAQKAIVAFLYWAEGSKTDCSSFRFTNTDPALCKLFLTLLRNNFAIEDKNIKITLYLHHYHDIAKTRNFWSELLKVPKNQFSKVYINTRKKTKRKRKNFAGICFINYGKGGKDLKRELMFLGKALQQKLSPCARSLMDRT